MKALQKEIIKDKQIIKFCYYGFLKNLRFFEPFLIIYLLSFGLNLFQIGLLYSIREILKYIFEIPSGIFADKYGKKLELCICFVLYIISFIFFFIGGNFVMLGIAMIFFGTGEAFRSGTHKAMIYMYLDEKGWFDLKSFVYGRTRSFSLIGSSVSALLSMIFVLQFDNLRILFLICIIPYLADFFLIISYPKSFNKRYETDYSFKKFIINCVVQIKSIIKNKDIIRIISSSSIFDALFKSIKDYIQPVLQMMLMGSSIVLFAQMNADDSLIIYLALIYGIVYLLSSIASRNVYRLKKMKSSGYIMNLFFDILGISFILLSVFIKINAIYLIIPFYFIIFILKDARRPVVIDFIGDYMEKQERASVLSVESQSSALLIVVFAPIFGIIADKFSISILFLVLGIVSIIINRFVRIKKGL